MWPAHFLQNGVRPSGRSICSFSEVRQLYSWIHRECCERVTSHFSATVSQTPEGAARIIMLSQGEESSPLSLSALAIAALVRHILYRGNEKFIENRWTLNEFHSVSLSCVPLCELRNLNTQAHKVSSLIYVCHDVCMIYCK